MSGLLPPNSKLNGKMRSAATRPPQTEPVKATLRTSRCDTKWFADFLAEPSQDIEHALRQPAFLYSDASEFRTGPEVASEGFTMTVLPAASAGEQALAA